MKRVKQYETNKDNWKQLLTIVTVSTTMTIVAIVLPDVQTDPVHSLMTAEQSRGLFVPEVRNPGILRNASRLGFRGSTQRMVGRLISWKT
jgi:hypothetical protein